MTASMTAFSRQEAIFEWGSISWEIRSVNQRYLEPTFRLPEGFKELEFPLRDTLRKQLNRGKVECQLRYNFTEQAASVANINAENAANLAKALDQLSNWFKELRPASGLEVLQYPGILAESVIDNDVMKNATIELFNQAINDLISARLREGDALNAMILQRLDSIDAIVSDIQQQLPSILAAQKQNLIDKVTAANVELDPMRIEAEIVLLAQKSDVAEELDRLLAHTKEVRRQLKQKGPIGRRLDFLMQELNREANTLSSKSIVIETTQHAVELKVLIEQMREQIQNIE
ncbi:YicC family protein [Marinomonas agarivorans]|nr:YicC family protein [Marinomonas agarivorans]